MKEKIKNKKPRRQYDDKYYQKNKEKLKKYYQENKEKVDKKHKEWCQKNKEHLKKYKIKWFQKHPQYSKEWRKKDKYNLTLNQIDDILIRQNRKCLICGKSLIKIQKCIDHNHKTNKVRGILCIQCNLGLGMFKDNADLLKKAIIYLENHKEKTNGKFT